MRYSKAILYIIDTEETRLDIGSVVAIELTGADRNRKNEGYRKNDGKFVELYRDREKARTLTHITQTNTQVHQTKQYQ